MTLIYQAACTENYPAGGFCFRDLPNTELYKMRRWCHDNCRADEWIDNFEEYFANISSYGCFFFADKKHAALFKLTWFHDKTIVDGTHRSRGIARRSRRDPTGGRVRIVGMASAVNCVQPPPLDTSKIPI